MKYRIGSSPSSVGRRLQISGQSATRKYDSKDYAIPSNAREPEIDIKQAQADAEKAMRALLIKQNPKISDEVIKAVLKRAQRPTAASLPMTRPPAKPA